MRKWDDDDSGCGVRGGGGCGVRARGGDLPPSSLKA